MADILIVDDIAENLQVLQLILKSGLHSIRAATSAKVALKLVKKKQPDLIITDIQMPIMTGIELCRILKKDDEFKYIPIIFVSAQTDTDNIVKALEAGGVDYLTKPFQPTEITARVNTQLKLIKAQTLRVNQELSQVMSQMVIGIAHEINTPLGTSITAVSLLLDVMNSVRDKLEQQTLSASQLELAITNSQQSLSLCQRNLNRVAEFVDLLNNISKAKGPLQATEKNIKTTINDIISVAKNHCKGLTIDITFDISKECFNLDIEMLSLILNNLIQDSYIHGQISEQAHICIVFTEKEKSLEIHYTDHGIGLQDISVEQYLKPFFTSKRGNNRHVGLSAPMVAYAVTGALNGHFKVNSSDNGIEWFIDIPQ